MLRDYQQQTVDSIFNAIRNREDNPVAVLPTGCHSAGHPILMFNGDIVRVEQVRVGTHIMGPDYQPRTVLNLCRGRDMMYMITPELGNEFQVNGDHILSLIHKLTDEIVNIKVVEYLEKTPKWKGEHSLYYSYEPLSCLTNRYTLTDFIIQETKEDNYYGFTLDDDHLYLDGNRLVHHNSGKSHCIAEVVRKAVQEWDGKILAITHVKELVEQNVEKLRQLAPEIDLGIYSAGLGQRDASNSVIFGSIQSMYKKANEFGQRDLILIDESHLLSEESDSMYQKFIKKCKEVCPHLRVVGFTATPFRLKSGPLCTKDGILNHICIDINIAELIEQGYLSPLVSKSGKNSADTSKLHTRAGEFISSEAEALMNDSELVKSACAEIVEKSKDRKAVLIFTTGVKHAKNVIKILNENHGVDAQAIFGHTSIDKRDKIVQGFKNKEFKYFVNVNVLTTGFDAPHVDCIALLRPTQSTGLYVQMLGRGSRLSPDKENCLILDYGENILRHGPVDMLNINQENRGKGETKWMVCPNCQSIIPSYSHNCKDCGYKFRHQETEDSKHGCKASEADVLSNKKTTKKHKVYNAFYDIHTKKDALPEDPKTMVVEYEVGEGIYVKEWICIEHSGYAKRKAAKWWKERTDLPMPNTALEAVKLAEEGKLIIPGIITVTKEEGSKFNKITKYDFTVSPVDPDEDDFLNYDPIEENIPDGPDYDDMPF